MVSTLDHRQMSLDDNHINLIKTYWIDAQKGCPTKEQWPGTALYLLKVQEHFS